MMTASVATANQEMESVATANREMFRFQEPQMKMFLHRAFPHRFLLQSVCLQVWMIPIQKRFLSVSFVKISRQHLDLKIASVFKNMKEV